MNNERERNNSKFRWLIGAFLLAAVVAGLLRAGRGSTSSVDLWKAEMRARGEAFTVAELLSGHKPSPTNRLADLVRLGQALNHPNSAVSSLLHRELLTNGLATATWMRTNLGLTTAIGKTPRGTVPTAIGSYDWSDLAADLTSRESTFGELRLLLVTPDHETGWNYDRRATLPRCWTEKRQIAQWFAAAHTAHLHAGEWAAADADLTALLQLVAWHEQDFTIIGQSIRSALGGLAATCTWSALQSTYVTEAQLAAYHSHWQQLSLVSAMIRTMEFERANIDSIFVELRNGRESYSSALGTGSTGAARLGESVMGLAWRALAAEADEFFYLRFMQGHINALRQLQRVRSWAAAEPIFATNNAQLAVFDRWPGRVMLISGMATPNFSRIFTNLHRYETERELTIAALALERFRLRRGHYPGALTELVPEFVAAVPVDWMDGKPLRYRRNADGRFTLWSIGEDLKDDGGDPTPTSAGSSRNPFWERRDVVWPVAPR